MNLSDYNDARQNGNFGQFFGAVFRSDNGFKAEYKKQGYCKVTRLNVQIQKKNYVQVLNTTTGAEKAGIDFKPLRESHYNDEGLNGMFCSLKSNGEKKYVKFVWDDDKNNTCVSVYVDGDGNIIGESLDDVKHMMTPSYLKSLNGEYGRDKVKKAAGIKVRQIQVKIENIAELRVGGKTYIDELLKHIIPYVK